MQQPLDLLQPTLPVLLLHLLEQQLVLAAHLLRITLELLLAPLHLLA